MNADEVKGTNLPVYVPKNSVKLWKLKTHTMFKGFLLDAQQTAKSHPILLILKLEQFIREKTVIANYIKVTSATLIVFL